MQEYAAKEAKRKEKTKKSIDLNKPELCEAESIFVEALQ